MTLQVGDVLISRKLYPDSNIDIPVGELHIHGCWTLIKFDEDALYLVIQEIYVDNNKFVVELVSLENAYRFMFRTTMEQVNTLCEVIHQECNLGETCGRVNT